MHRKNRRDAARSHIARELHERPPTGKAMFHACLTFVMYVRGSKSLVDDDLSVEWESALNMFGDMMMMIGFLGRPDCYSHRRP